MNSYSISSFSFVLVFLFFSIKNAHQQKNQRSPSEISFGKELLHKQRAIFNDYYQNLITENIIIKDETEAYKQLVSARYANSIAISGLFLINTNNKTINIGELFFPSLR